MTRGGATFSNTCTRCGNKWTGFGVDGKNGKCTNCGSVNSVMRERIRSMGRSTEESREKTAQKKLYKIASS